MVRIEIVTDLKARMKEENKYIKDVISGKAEVKPTVRTILITPEVFTKIFSPQRINLILKIKQDKIKNIYQIAKDLDRSYEAVYRDIKFLEGFGLIKIKTKERKKLPYMDEPINIPLFAK